jgi:hypothetical protein
MRANAASDIADELAPIILILLLLLLLASVFYQRTDEE